ncbi:MAG: hydroxyacid dehydrogenase [Spirochaetales bacterium]|nr:MAG: hydroxyacid dehydrogenase [Spirochaetales bacterium]
MRIGINTGDRYRTVFNEGARAKLKGLGNLGAEPAPGQGMTPEDVMSSCRDAEVVVGTWGMQPFTPEILSACPDLKLVVYAAGTVKYFVTDELCEKGVTVCSAADINGRPVAEFVLGLILTTLKHVSSANRDLRLTGPDGWHSGKTRILGYFGSRIGLLGFGRITRMLIEFLKPFDLEVLVEDNYLSEDVAGALGVRKSTREEIMGTCDVVSLHHADVPEHHGIINKHTLSLMKPGSVLINTARGRLVVEEDLVEALKTRDLWAYLDVTHPEPPASGHPFYTLPNCVLTPHIAGSIGTEVERMGNWAVNQVQAFTAGKTLEGIVDLTTLSSIA